MCDTEYSVRARPLLRDWHRRRNSKLEEERPGDMKIDVCMCLCVCVCVCIIPNSKRVIQSALSVHALGALCPLESCRKLYKW